MRPDTSLALSTELRHVLKEGWILTLEGDGFRVKPPTASNLTPNFDRVLRAEVWRVAQFVAYANFVSIARLPSAGYVVASHMASGEGFIIRFDPY